jgi:hypothetical protein
MPKPNADDEGVYYRPIGDILNEIGRGALAREASQLMAELVVAVVDQRKAGTLTIKVTLKPVKDSNAEVLTVSGTVTTTAPRAVPASVFYGDETGFLSRKDPRQMDLFDQDQNSSEETHTR